MKNILSLLERFTKIIDKDVHTKETIGRVIKERTGAVIDNERVTIKNYVLEVEASPSIKNAIRLKEDLIKEELKEVYQIFISRILYK